MTTSKPPSGDLSIVEAEGINAKLYNFFIKSIEELENSSVSSIGAFLTEVLECYIDTKDILDLEKNSETSVITTNIQVKKVNPTIHQKFIEHIKEIYKSQNFTSRYNKEVNKALTVYMLIHIPRLIYRRAAGKTALNMLESSESIETYLTALDILGLRVNKENYQIFKNNTIFKKRIQNTLPRIRIRARSGGHL